MMRIQITGGTGYIGRHVVKHALAAGYDVELITRHSTLDKFFNPAEVARIRVQHVRNLMEAKADASARLIHLAWDNVGSYKDIRLVTETVPHQIDFLMHMIAGGSKDLTLAGTCLEYGLREGVCKETDPAQPVTYYGLAKHIIHEALAIHTRVNPHVKTKWLRYFYIFGEGQREGSLFGQLAKAIQEGKTEFPMSPADQQRDFIDVSSAASSTLKVATQSRVTGIINIGSGQPRSVLDQAEILKGNAQINFKTGVYPYPDYEPFSFWASTEKLRAISDTSPQ